MSGTLGHQGAEDQAHHAHDAVADPEQLDVPVHGGRLMWV